ncbi:hypothetical protein Acr_15g0011290 [Actinidia rufa]|uniref:Uncharacterized protein n=1 Tax=Actinidia rufa TaxID=165716 RepID=A0A7J0FV26_9ERIC|nr:hypothetical protein Acr_15g0011290 [Actinidia rufa]
MGDGSSQEPRFGASEEEARWKRVPISSETRPRSRQKRGIETRKENDRMKAHRLYSGGGLLRTSEGDEVLLKAQKMDNLWRRVGSVAIGGATIKYQTNAIAMCKSIGEWKEQCSPSQRWGQRFLDIQERLRQLAK